MASSAYYTWVSKGKPYTLTKPAGELQNLLEGYGYTVYDYPNEAHQTAEPPEDHTPYSATEWPVQISAYVAHALDIMPPGAAAQAQGAIPLPDLARRIIADRDARVPGTMWIKYMNWTDENGVCRQESWKTTPRATKSSTDKGHIHVSARTDTETYSIGEWDPVMATLTDDNVHFRALIYRVLALIDNTDTVVDSAAKGEVNQLKGQLVRIEAQAKSNGSNISTLISTLSQVQAVMGQVNQALTDLVTKVEALELGGLDEAALEQKVRDGVRAELNATRFTNG